MFFETFHSLSEGEFKLAFRKQMTFQLHIHRSYEFFEQISGSTEVVIDDRKYLLKSGEAVLIFPLQSHSYTSLEEGQIRLCIFSPDMVSEFYKRNEGQSPTDHKFRCGFPQEISLENPFHKKAFTYFICGEFDKGRHYTPTTAQMEERLLIRLLLFAEQNFGTQCLLRDAATEIGYDYAYVSKFFKQKVGISFRKYVNNLRIIESKHLLKNTVDGIEAIGERCGFSSLRVFDREFRLQVGLSPSEYRKRHSAGTNQ